MTNKTLKLIFIALLVVIFAALPAVAKEKDKNRPPGSDKGEKRQEKFKRRS